MFLTRCSVGDSAPFQTSSALVHFWHASHGDCYCFLVVVCLPVVVPDVMCFVDVCDVPCVVPLVPRPVSACGGRCCRPVACFAAGSHHLVSLRSPPPPEPPGAPCHRLPGGGRQHGERASGPQPHTLLDDCGCAASIPYHIKRIPYSPHTEKARKMT